MQCRFCDKVFLGGPSKISCHMTTGGQVSKCNPHSSRKLEYEICRKAVVAPQEEFQKNKKEVNRQKMENYADTPNVGDLKKYMKGSKESFEVADAAVGDWIFCEGKCLSTCDSDKFRTMLQAVEKAGSSYVRRTRTDCRRSSWTRRTTFRCKPSSPRVVAISLRTARRFVQTVGSP